MAPIIEIVGVGFVGLTTAIVAANAGYSVVGIEQDKDRLELLSAGVLPFSEPGLEREMASALEKGNLSFSGSDHKRYSPAVLILATPTPTLPSGEPDVSSVRDALCRFWDPLRHSLVIIRSTVLPGTIEAIAAAVKFSGLAAQIVHWPEFLNQGKALEELRSPDRVVIGADSDAAAARAHKFLLSIKISLAKYQRVTLREAEAVKHFSNAVLAVNQVLAAEIARLCEGLGIDSSAVLASVAADSRLDSTLLRPRPPLVDSCLAKDLTALSENLSLERDSSILGATLQRAELSQRDAVQRLSRHVKLASERTKILIIGAGFSPAVSDTNGSLLWKILPEMEGEELTVWDPYVDDCIGNRLGAILRRENLCEIILESDVVVLLVPHPQVVALEWEGIIKGMKNRRASLLDYSDFFSEKIKRVAGFDDVVHTFGNARCCSICVE